jgi:hypothetical protein
MNLTIEPNLYMETLVEALRGRLYCSRHQMGLRNQSTMRALVWVQALLRLRAQQQGQTPSAESSTLPTRANKRQREILRLMACLALGDQGLHPTRLSQMLIAFWTPIQAALPQQNCRLR